MQSFVRPRRPASWLAGHAAPGLLMLLAASPVRADGFGVYTQGARATGMGGAWVARVMDPSAVFYNVAGMSQLSGTQVYGGVAFLRNSGNDVTLFEDGGQFEQRDKTFAIPHLYLTHELSDRFALGVGVFTPYGLGIEWEREGFPGRFRSYDADLKTIYVQPSVAYAAGDAFAIGAGVDFVWSDIELNRESDLATLPLTSTGATFGQLTGLPANTVGFLDSQLRADGTGVGFNLGVLVRPSPFVQLGLSYRSQVEIDYEGDAEFTQIPTGILLPPGNPLGLPGGTPLDGVLRGRLPASQAATTTITMPDQVVGGISLTPTERWMVNADLKWTNFEDFDVVLIEFAEENPGQDAIDARYENGTSYRIGTEYLLNPAFALRAGYIRDETPVPERSVTPLLPDANRNEFSLGFGYTTGPLQFDGFALLEIFEKRDGPVGADNDLPDGTYDTQGILFGLDVGYRF